MIVIIGTGAVAAELTMFFPVIKGYLEYPENIPKYYNNYKLKWPVLGTVDDYKIHENDRFVLGTSNIEFRKQIIEKVRARGGKFGNLISPLAQLSGTVKMGEGNIIYPQCIISVNVEMGSFNLLTCQSILSHDCQIGNNNVLATTLLCGHVKCGDDNYFGIRSTVIPGIQIGYRNIIQAGQIVDKNVGDDSVVFHRFRENVIHPKV